jgi:hypothetical protein
MATNLVLVSEGGFQSPPNSITKVWFSNAISDDGTSNAYNMQPNQPIIQL